MSNDPRSVPHTPPTYAGPPPAAPPQFAPQPLPQYAPPGGPNYPRGPLGPYGYQPSVIQAPLPTKNATVGVLSLIFGIVATVLAPVCAALGAVALGNALRAAHPDSNLSLWDLPEGTFQNLSWASPARANALWIDLSAWGGGLLWALAIVLGLIAIAQKRGKKPGKAGLILGCTGWVLYLVVLIGTFAITVA